MRSIPDVLPESKVRTTTWSVRLITAFATLLCITVLAFAAYLTPDPSGTGTHTQIGLPPCGLIALTGIPCPSCGFTTSFTHSIRGEFISGIMVQPMGFVLFLMTLVMAVSGPFLVYRGISLAEWLGDQWMIRIMSWMIGGILISWAFKVWMVFT